VAGSAAQGGTLLAGDRDFVGKAANGGIAEVELGKLARSRGSNDAVRQFGQRMVTDHGKANDELMQIAQAKNLSLSRELDTRHRHLRDRLVKLSGNDFDRAYTSETVKDHRKDVAGFKKQAIQAKDPDLRAWAAQKLPTLQEHLRLAEALDAQVKTVKSGSLSNRWPLPRSSGQAPAEACGPDDRPPP
jgi:putative membrane protein